MGMSLAHFTTMNKNPNNFEMLEILIKKGIDVNSIAQDNTSPLHYACATGLISLYFIFNSNMYIF